MRLTGPRHKKLRKIIEQAFNRRELKQALAESDPSRDFDSLVVEATFPNQISELLGIAERHGWLAQLIAILKDERSDRPDLIEQATAIIEPDSAPSATFPDDRSRELAEALERAQLHHEELTSAGEDASPALEEILAVKVLHGQYAHDRSRRDRFFRGARKMAELQHQSIVRVIEPRLEEEGYHYFVMELAEGGDLRRAVLEDRLNLNQKLAILRSTGRALEHAHARGIIHRDVKPANVLLDASDQAKLTDFDLVRAQDSTGGTRTGMLGTVIYAAPEALERAKDADVTADVYGLGMTGIFVLHGKDLPARELLRDAPGFARRLDAPVSVREALAEAVAWEPENRQASVAELFIELKQQDAPLKRPAPQLAVPAQGRPTRVDRTTFETLPRHRSRSRIEDLKERLEKATDWRERAKIFKQIPQGVDDARSSLETIESLRERTFDTHDLFFLGQLTQDIAQRWPESGQDAGELLRRLYADRTPPPNELFTRVKTRDGPVELWRKIAADSFQMGSPDSEPDYHGKEYPLGAFWSERPQHEVRISQPFMLMVVPVNNAMYRAFDPSHRAKTWTGVGERELDHHPVVNVDWYKATAFCRWLSHHGFAGARLPTESEWEYTCRAGTSSRFWSGGTNEALDRVAWYQANARSRTHRTHNKPANPWGIYEMHGNVWEWCADAWDAEAYTKRAQEHPAIDPHTEADIWNTEAFRVLRGGSWSSPARELRAAYRSRSWHGGRNTIIGFRVCFSDSERI